MENWYEDTFDGVEDIENDQEIDDIEAAEEEAALYSVIHHQESFEIPEDSSGINCDNYPLSSKSKASRWYKIPEIVSSNSPYENDKRPKKCADYISLEPPNLQRPASRSAKSKRNRRSVRYNREGKKYSNGTVKQSRGRIYHSGSQYVPSTLQHEINAPNVPSNTPKTVEFSFIEEFKKLQAAKASEVMQSVDNIPATTKFFENPLPWPEVNNVQDKSVPQIEHNILGSETCHNLPPLDEVNRENRTCVENCSNSKNPCDEGFPAKANDTQEKISSTLQEFVPDLNEVTLVLSDADSDVVEIQIPPKPPPPVIALDSGDEVDKRTAAEEDPDVIVLDSDYEDLTVVENARPTLLNVMSVNLSNDIHTDIITLPQTTLQVESRQMSPKKSKGKEPKKKKRKRKSCDKVQCNNAKNRMEKFYNESWGGETFDHTANLRKMSNNPQHWKIIEADRYGYYDNNPLARIRCRHCNEPGHIMKNCPRFKVCCFMCGQIGHRDGYCPAKICLRCGRPSTTFSSGCIGCASTPLRCDKCGQKDHFQLLCPTIWRRYHSVTTVEEAKNAVLPAPVYKAPHQLVCCICAEHGHMYSACPRKGNIEKSDGLSNSFHQKRLRGASVGDRKPMKRKQRHWHGETSTQNWNDYHQKKRRTF